ncbi:hypothetical protein PtB15_3B534 [Puccinia triticina]|nr:hypothetical protein PtB15_3B534 [Puccinia triticina]
MTNNPEAATSHTMTNNESMDKDPAPTGYPQRAIRLTFFTFLSCSCSLIPDSPKLLPQNSPRS